MRRLPALLVPLLLAAPALLVSLGDAPLQRAEVYFLDGARGMLESGDWLVPRHRSEAFFDKPALSYWLMAGAMRVLGVAPLSARLVSVLAALGALAATFWVGLQLFEKRTATCAALVLAATPAFLGFGRLAMSDMLLTLWCTLALGLGLAALQPPRPAWALPLLGAVLGLGFLTKGPIALVLPGLALALFARRNGPRAAVRWFEWAAALGLFAVLGLSWFALVGWRLGSGPLVHFFLRENLARFGGQAYDSGRGPFFYIGSYALLGLPWSALLPLAAYRLRREEPSRALLLWLLLALATLSLSRGKLDYYLLPLYPAAALLVGRFLADVRWNAADLRWVRSVLALLTLIALSGPLLLQRLPAGWQPAALQQLVLLLCSGLAAAALVWVLMRPTPAGVAWAVALATLGLATAFQAAVLPALWAHQPVALVVEEVRREQRPGLRVVACHDGARVERELLFHLRLVVVHDCGLAGAARSSQPTLLLLYDDEDVLLRELPGLRVIGRHEFLPAKVWRFLALGQPVSMRRLAVASNAAASEIRARDNVGYLPL